MKSLYNKDSQTSPKKKFLGSFGGLKILITFAVTRGQNE
jgi:hypothetical protein